MLVAFSTPISGWTREDGSFMSSPLSPTSSSDKDSDEPIMDLLDMCPESACNSRLKTQKGTFAAFQDQRKIMKSANVDVLRNVCCIPIEGFLDLKLLQSVGQQWCGLLPGLPFSGHNHPLNFSALAVQYLGAYKHPKTSFSKRGQTAAGCFQLGPARYKSPIESTLNSVIDGHFKGFKAFGIPGGYLFPISVALLFLAKHQECSFLVETYNSQRLERLRRPYCKAWKSHTPRVYMMYGSKLIMLFR